MLLQPIFWFFAISIFGVLNAQPRIFNATDAKIEDFPNNAFIFGTCGGAILDEWHILTAKHCIHLDKPSGFQMRVGSSNKSSGGQVVRHSSVNRHPKYDVIMIKLKEPILFNKKVQPVNLPEKPLPDGTEFEFVGWGLTEHGYPNILKKLRMKFYNNNNKTENCKRDPEFVCTYSPYGNACFGDSGAPIIYNNTIYGITHAITGKCKHGIVLSTSVLYIRKWIDSILKK